METWKQQRLTGRVMLILAATIATVASVYKWPRVQLGIKLTLFGSSVSFVAWAFLYLISARKTRLSNQQSLKTRRPNLNEMFQSLNKDIVRLASTLEIVTELDMPWFSRIFDRASKRQPLNIKLRLNKEALLLMLGGEAKFWGIYLDALEVGRDVFSSTYINGIEILEPFPRGLHSCVEIRTYAISKNCIRVSYDDGRSWFNKHFRSKRSEVNPTKPWIMQGPLRKFVELLSSRFSQ